ncbi:MAG: AzlD domain-containing protein [Candidatus Nanopelagicales bacterium]|jgi:branched-subunit amino acid transport protein|nr:AzlD domain-containing protein [Candidatus Nanopelagicales bacterium]
MSDLLIIAAVGLGTYAMRAAFLLRRGEAVREQETPVLQQVAPAVLAAITLPALLAPRGTVSLPDTSASLAAAAACFLIWRHTRRFPNALLAGLVTWWLALAILPGA